MPITKSAKKAIRGSLRKRGHNDQRRKTMKELIKKIDKLAKSGGDKGREDAKKMLSAAFKAIDKAAQKGVIKKNNAANKKSRLSRLLK